MMKLNIGNYKYSELWKDIAFNWISSSETEIATIDSYRGISVAVYDHDIVPHLNVYQASTWYEFLESSGYLGSLLVYFNDEEDRQNLSWLSEDEVDLLSFTDTIGTIGIQTITEEEARYYMLNILEYFDNWNYEEMKNGSVRFIDNQSEDIPVEICYDNWKVAIEDWKPSIVEDLHNGLIYEFDVQNGRCYWTKDDYIRLGIEPSIVEVNYPQDLCWDEISNEEEEELC